MHELHIQLSGTTNRPAAIKLPQKMHSTILTSTVFISVPIRHCRRGGWALIGMQNQNSGK